MKVSDRGREQEIDKTDTRKKTEKELTTDRRPTNGHRAIRDRHEDRNKKMRERPSQRKASEQKINEVQKYRKQRSCPQPRPSLYWMFKNHAYTHNPPSIPSQQAHSILSVDTHKLLLLTEYVAGYKQLTAGAERARCSHMP